MTNITQILQSAQQRAAQNRLPYSGALTPLEAYEVLQKTPHAKLVDVRTTAELELVGKIPGATHIEWAFYPGMVANPDFAVHLEMQVDKEALVIFICRTGGRSHNAAATAAKLGFTEAYNMLEGFEGDVNEKKQRTLINGWKKAGLPWTN
ncbi:MAG TPA: rhodanese-like domain-containing protein [Methylotenera sp.]|nr:rhodanese-like domain-containing protein [Methylotenera sp.]HPV44268.1 rhodanese-like domain-containing protein [Methylotenera sp.]